VDNALARLNLRKSPVYGSPYTVRSEVTVVLGKLGQIGSKQNSKAEWHLDLMAGEKGLRGEE
jgi:hypothetical protein